MLLLPLALFVFALRVTVLELAPADGDRLGLTGDFLGALVVLVDLGDHIEFVVTADADSLRMLHI